jgi:hypothetical protein
MSGVRPADFVNILPFRERHLIGDIRRNSNREAISPTLQGLNSHLYILHGLAVALLLEALSNLRLGVGYLPASQPRRRVPGRLCP